MAYITQMELTDKMPLGDIVQACTDKSNQQSPEEVWEAICTGVAEDIDGLLAPRYSHPFPAPIHPRLKTAARWMTLESLYLRRGLYGEANPATSKADAERKALREIGSGKILLDATTPQPVAPAGSAGAATTETLTTKPSIAGRLLF